MGPQPRPFRDINVRRSPRRAGGRAFGFERGAFTDARRPSRAVSGGTRRCALLDEIALLPESLQASLTAIEERAVRRSAVRGRSRRRLAERHERRSQGGGPGAAVSGGPLPPRGGLTLDLPPLRPAATTFCCWPSVLARACAEYGLRPSAGCRARRGCWRRWSRNIRELGNAIERAAVFTDTAAVTAESRAHCRRATTVPSGAPDGDVDSRDEAMRLELLAALEEMGGTSRARRRSWDRTEHGIASENSSAPVTPHKAAPAPTARGACLRLPGI